MSCSSVVLGDERRARLGTMKGTFIQSLVVCMFIMIWCPGSFAQASSKEQVIEVPFDFYRNEIILAVKVNGKGPFLMMLDTGTDPSAVDLNTAREIGLKLDPIGRQAEGGGTGVNLAYETKLPLLEVNNLTAKNVQAVAMDLSHVSGRLGKPIHGILGHSFLKGRVVQIDYPTHRIRFSKSQPSEAVNQPNNLKRTVLPFRYEDSILIDDVTVNGKKVIGDLDTGSDGTFKLTPAAVSYIGLEEEVIKAQATESVGYNGIAGNREGKVRNVTIGTISLDGPAVIFFGKGTGRDKKVWGINIGNAFLKDFIVTIDYRNRTLTLERQ